MDVVTQVRRQVPWIPRFGLKERNSRSAWDFEKHTAIPFKEKVGLKNRFQLWQRRSVPAMGARNRCNSSNGNPVRHTSNHRTAGSARNLSTSTPVARIEHACTDQLPEEPRHRHEDPCPRSSDCIPRGGYAFNGPQSQMNDSTAFISHSATDREDATPLVQPSS